MWLFLNLTLQSSDGGLLTLLSAHLKNTFREYVSAGYRVFLQGSGLFSDVDTHLLHFSAR